MDFGSWRAKARQLLALGTLPSDARFEDAQLGFDLSLAAPEPAVSVFKIDPEFIRLAETASHIREDSRWTLLYRVLYRLKFENPHLMKVTVDDDVLQMHRWAKAIGRDIHKMHAFVRFKRIEDEGVEKYVAWHQPEHLVVRLATPFFARRFGDKPWSIFTPDLSAHWDLKELTFDQGRSLHEFPYRDEMDDIWKTYYSSIFNPARIKLKAMTTEMPIKYWSSLPEAGLIQDLVVKAPERLQTMARKQAQKAEPPPTDDWEEFVNAAKQCTACPLYQKATQTVFGEGSLKAELMVVGEQPGDQEDRAGRPFVGPAGRILDQALQAASIERERVYVTNAVKHFKFEDRGKFRLHKKPTGSEMHACRPWLEAELAKIKPTLVVLLGATAGTSYLGRVPKVTVERGQILNKNSERAPALLTWHPSAILRAQNEAEKTERFDQLVEDLKVAYDFLRAGAQSVDQAPQS